MIEKRGRLSRTVPEQVRKKPDNIKYRFPYISTFQIRISYVNSESGETGVKPGRAGAPVRG